jgi:hypothetical protein
VGFEPTIPVFERAKTVHALDCAATVNGALNYNHSVKSGFLPPRFVKWGKSKVVTVLKRLNTTPFKHMGKWRYITTSLSLGTTWR